MNILFITSSHFYLYQKLLLKIINYFNNHGHNTIVLARYSESDYFNKAFKDFSFFKTIFYGKKYFNTNQNDNLNYLAKKFDYIQSINTTKKEIIDIIDNNCIHKVLAFDSYDIAVEIICDFKKSIPVYYIQHSSMVASLTSISLRQRYDNFLCKLFCGFKNIRTSNSPPFNNENLNYLLWTTIWSDNVKPDTYNIKYVPKILTKEKNHFSKPKNSITKILVILNKKRNIGKSNWKLFSAFYLSFFNEFPNYEVVFKTHPSENINFCKKNLPGYKVIKGEINITEYDLIFSHWSTFVFDAAIAQVPFILINPKNNFDYHKWRLDHYPLIVSEIGELKQKIDSIENDSININKILKDFVKISIGEDLDNSMKKLYSIIQKD